QPPSGELAERLQELSGLLNAHDLGAERCFQAIAVAYDLTGCAAQAAELELRLQRLEYERALIALGAMARALGFEDQVRTLPPPVKHD
ncbi:MAG: hypothetical protein ACR2RL_21165, partial [Gammaproteobacteria bacterium]